jgi:hypothetical protein
VALPLVTVFEANQLAGIVIVLDDVDISAFFRISLNHRELAISEGFDGFDLAIKVVVMNFADQNSARVFLDEINLPIKVPVALDPDELAVFVRFDNVGPLVTVSVDGDLVVVLVDAIYPVVRASIAVTVRNRTIRFPAAGDEAEGHGKEDYDLPHASL